MLKGTIVETSLTDVEILKKLHVTKSWSEGNWNLHQVQNSREEVLMLAKYIAQSAWYMHFWEQGQDDVLVIFRNKTFDTKYSDKSTWTDAVAYGKSIGIPEEQLDFLVN